MDTTFQYCRIGQAFHQELAGLVGARQSVVLLSLRNLGKRYALRMLIAKLQNDSAMLPVEVGFQGEPPLSESIDIARLVTEAVMRAAPGFKLTPARRDHELDAVKQLCEEQRRSVVLLASNVDSLAHHLAQSFLREVQTLVKKKGLTVVLTGEENLRNLVNGPTSEFNCANQFVIQGLDAEEFDRWVERRRALLNLPFAEAKTCLRQLFEQTGGNTYLARATLGALVETRTRPFEPVCEPVSTGDFVNFLDTLHESDACGVDVFCQTTLAVERSEKAWRDIEELLAGHAVTVVPASAPRQLELAGLAVRENDRLKFASPIMERFARKYYDFCRLGDLYVIRGEWEEGFSRYQRMPSSRRLRPGGIEDRVRLTLVIKALAGSLHAETTSSGGIPWERKLARIKELLRGACQYVLGLPELTWWTLQERGWKPLDQADPVPPTLAALAIEALKFANREKIGWQPIAGELGEKCAVVLLPSLRIDYRDAIVVSDSYHPKTLSPERAEFLRELLDQFATAYEHTIANYGIRERLKARQRHLEVATGILSALGESVTNPHEALKRAGQELLKLDYRRAMFSLVDAARFRIRGVVDCTRERGPFADVAGATDYSLTEPERDIQPWVATEKKPCVVADWPTWQRRRGTRPPINEGLCRIAGTRPNFAVVPMIIETVGPDKAKREEVFGTIHVERNDGLPPSEEDILDLLEFGRQMAAAAMQSERVHVLLTTLHGDTDAVVIVDVQGHILFANQVADERFGTPRGWHDAHCEIRADNREWETLLKKLDVTNVMGSGQPAFLYEDNRATHCSPLPDWWIEPPSLSGNGCPGEKPQPATVALIVVRDLTSLHQVFIALQEVANRASDDKSTVEAALASMEKLGYPSARLYGVDAKDPGLLVSVRARGLSPEFAEPFNRGGLRIEHHVPRDGSWRCLEEGIPCLFQWSPHKVIGSTELTPHGLTVTNFHTSAYEDSWKKPGDVWLDLPLVAANRHAIGKITVDCGSDSHCDLRPEKLELLKLFSALLGALLDAIGRKEKWVRLAADMALQDSAHHMARELRGITNLPKWFGEAAPDNAEVKKFSKMLQKALERTDARLKRITEMFEGMNAKPVKTGVKQMIDATLESFFERYRGAADAIVICGEELHFNLDPDRLGDALEEMFSNSFAMRSPGKILKLEVRAHVVERGAKKWLRISVRDNGPGIPPLLHETVFDRHFSVRPNDTASSGLGLDYVRRVVEGHHGQVRVNPDYADGAEFIIEIPESKPL